MTKYRIDSHGQADHCGASYYLVKEFDDEMTAHDDSIRRECADKYKKIIELEVVQLRKWAIESRNGGWSTHQVDPMNRRADELEAILGTEPAREGS